VRAPTSLTVPDAGGSPTPSAPDAADEGPPTVSGGLILAVVGALVLGLVGALWWALAREETPQAQPSASARSQTVPPTRAVDYPEQPAIDARSGPGEVTFTWNYVGVEEGDFYRLRVAGSEAAVPDQEVTTVQGRPRHTVRAGAGDQVCAQVSVSRKSGLASPLSAIRCETAG